MSLMLSGVAHYFSLLNWPEPVMYQGEIGYFSFLVNFQKPRQANVVSVRGAS